MADGDTGDNMALTLRAVLAELDRLSGGDGQRTVDEIGRDEIVQSVARAALLGARGNSGVILSQLIRGAAEELVSRPGQLIDATLIGAALANAADRAYSSVREPAEGTILTVAREMAHRIATDVAHSDDNPRLEPETEPTVQDRAIAAALESAVHAGEDSVKRGPELLAALREAGVVDAGGYGLTIIFAGVVAALRGEDPPGARASRPGPHHPPSAQLRHLPLLHQLRRDRVGRSARPASSSRSRAWGTRCWWSETKSPSRCTCTPTSPSCATALFDGVGEVSRLDVADMRIQVAERDGRLAAWGLAEEPSAASEEVRSSRPTAFVPPPAPAASVRCGAVAVVSGEGLKQMFNELGVHTIDGGPTLNPSTYDLLAGIHDVPTEEVVVLTNSANVIMAAEHAAKLSDKQVAGGPHDEPAGRARGGRGPRPGTLGRGERAGPPGCPLARAHRRGRAGRPRRRTGPLRRSVTRWASSRTRSMPGASPKQTLQAVLEELSGGSGRRPAPGVDQRPRRGGPAARAGRARGDDGRRHRARAAPRRPGRLLVADRSRVAPPPRKQGGAAGESEEPSRRSGVTTATPIIMHRGCPATLNTPRRLWRVPPRRSIGRRMPARSPRLMRATNLVSPAKRAPFRS